MCDDVCSQVARGKLQTANLSWPDQLQVENCVHIIFHQIIALQSMAVNTHRLVYGADGSYVDGESEGTACSGAGEWLVLFSG